MNFWFFCIKAKELFKKNKSSKSKTTEKQRDNIYTLVLLAVRAAEQIFNTEGQGLLKKEFVVDYLNSKGIKISIEDLEIFIEAAVKELEIINRIFANLFIANMRFFFG